MGLLLSFSALIVSTIFLQLGNGAIAPLDALAGINASFSGTEIGLLGSAHFLGFLFGVGLGDHIDDLPTSLSGGLF